MGKENLGAEFAPGGKERESGIELLRILAVAGVVILHYNSVGGALGYAPLNDLNFRILCALESAFICAVNTFMIISGYFMYGKLRVSLRKPVSLLVQLIVFEVTLYLLKVVAGQGAFAWKSLALCLIPADYFVILYVVTYLLSPYVNFLASKLGEKRLRKLLIMLFLLFSVQPWLVSIAGEVLNENMDSATTISLFGAQGGYTIVNFIMCFMIGLGIRCGSLKAYRPLPCLVAYMLSTLLVYFLSNWNWSISWVYYSPLVIIQAYSVFMLYKSMKINIRAINKLARAVFTVYLLHRTFLVRSRVIDFVQGSAFLMFGHMLATEIIIFALCFVVYQIWNMLTRAVSNCIFAKLGIPDINLESAQT